MVRLNTLTILHNANATKWLITKKQTIFKHAYSECYYTYSVTTDKSSNYLPPSKQLLPISVTSICNRYKNKTKKPILNIMSV